MRRKRKQRKTWVGLFGVTVSSQVGKNPSQTTITAKCPRLRCRSREQAAIALRSLFEFAVRETNKSCGCFVFLYVFGCKGTIFPSHSDTFLKNILWTHSFFFIINLEFTDDPFLHYQHRFPYTLTV